MKAASLLISAIQPPAFDDKHECKREHLNHMTQHGYDGDIQMIPNMFSIDSH